jgi:hypothetical protein
MSINQEIITTLLESLKLQAEKYKEVIQQSDITLEERKDFDNQISEIFDVLEKISNTQLILSINDIEQYKIELAQKLSQVEEQIASLDISTLTVDFNTLTDEQKNSLKGADGQDGLSFTFDDLTESQKLELKGDKGDKGDTGSSLSYSDLTEEQKQDLASYVSVEGGSSSSSIKSINQKLPVVNAGGICIKTNVLFDRPLIYNIHIFKDNSTSRSDASNIISIGAESPIIYKVNKLTSVPYWPYISEDGFLCFSFYYDNYTNIIISMLDNTDIEILEFMGHNSSYYYGEYSSPFYVGQEPELPPVA